MRKAEKDNHDSAGGHTKHNNDNNNNSDGGGGGGVGGGGVEDDDMLEYQTDGVMLEEVYGSGDGERMQLNPSSDFYDDDDDDDDDDGDYYVGDDKIVDDDDDDDGEPEVLPEAKSLVQALTSAGSSSASTNRRVMSPMDEEEEDMGYDEDDERYAAAAMERPKANRDFMNEEGSGAGGLRRYGSYHGYKHNSNNNNYKHNYNDHRLGAKLPSSAAGVVVSNVGIGASDDGSVGGGGGVGVGGGRRDEVAARESSGNFANDDEDDEDDDDDDGIDDGDGFFNSKRTSGGGGIGGGVGGNGNGNGGGNRYFRKNTNDAIKIISTPLGKVGIVYQQTPDETAPAAEVNSNKKPVSTFTDFDALSPDPDSSRRLQSSHPKITPVLTADGKVALLYRGDSESSKYEPIRNVTHKFGDGGGGSGGNAAPDGKRTGTDSKTNSNNNNSNDDDDQDASSNDSDSTGDDDDVALAAGGAGGLEGDGVEKKLVVGGGAGAGGGGNGMPGMPVFSPVVPTGGPFILRHPTDSVLPMINRPLSEVLGIKKNQYTHIRIRDGIGGADAAATANGGSGGSTEANAAAMPPRTLATGGLSPEQSTNTLHFLTNKVNLADYPTSARTRTFDFDFSRDNTMLDERTRQKAQLEQQQQQTEQNTVANEELLSKTEVVNLAIVPHFDEDLERLQRLHEHETRRHHRQRHHRHKQTTSEEDLSGIHCIMQAMMGIAAISTVFGMLGTFFKQRILDQLRLLHW